MEHHSVVSKDEARVPSAHGIWPLCLRIVLRGAYDLSFPTSTQFYDEVMRAELAGEMSEFYAIGFQAVFAMGSHSEFTQDYLNMVDDMAASPEEKLLASLWRTMYMELDFCGGAEFDRQWLARNDATRDDDALVALNGGLSAMFRNLGIIQSNNAGSACFQIPAVFDIRDIPELRGSDVVVSSIADRLTCRATHATPGNPPVSGSGSYGHARRPSDQCAGKRD